MPWLSHPSRDWLAGLTHRCRHVGGDPWGSWGLRSGNIEDGIYRNWISLDIIWYHCTILYIDLRKLLYHFVLDSLLNFSLARVYDLIWSTNFYPPTWNLILSLEALNMHVDMPVFPALPLIDLQDSASKIPLLRALLLEDRSEGQTCDWCDWCGWCKSNKVSNLKRLNKYGQRTSQILWTSLNCDAIYPHSSSLPQVFAAISCACGRGCCGCYISAGRRCSARDPTDATNPITLGQVVMALYFLPERCGRAGRGH